MKIIERARAYGKNAIAALTPSDIAWRGAATALYLLVTLIAVAFFTAYFIQDFTLQKLPSYLVRTGSAFAVGAVAFLALGVISRIPPVYRLPLIVFAPFALLAVATGNEKESIVFSVAVLLIVSFIGAGIAVLRAQGFKPKQQKVSLSVLGLGVVALVAGLYAIFSDKDPVNPWLDDYVLTDRTLVLPNPGLAGNYEVLALTYGSGKDKRRDEFGEDVDLRARSVDGSKLIDNWDGLTGWLRTSYWGFDATELPLQARVWYPAGDGPFPLVLIVHGNHSMEDFSDPGYGYLGELFASRGFIFASVDENFVNSSISAWIDLFANRPGLEEENDARGWLLLQHLAQWRDWNNQSGHPFFNKVDIDRVALIGHSRGGEAVGIAAAFNSLDRYPDDATLDFDFGFNLRGVIAIAPVYGQYQPRERYTPVRDVNYFTIHGDMDGDVQSFEGMAQYSKVSFTEGSFGFRSGLYVVGANHGQFNTTWENLDTSIFRAWALDLDGIMDGEAQRDVARVYFGAFLEVVLNDRYEYLPIFRDARYAAGWLPETFYINQYADSRQRVIADFEEDIDPATMTLPGGRISMQNLSKWYEVGNELKYDELDTHSLVVAWDEKFSDETARIDFSVPPDGIDIGIDSVIVASISAADIGTLPDDWESDGGDDQAVDERDDSEDEVERPLNWTIQLTDVNGLTASLPLSHDAELYPQVQAVPRRSSFLDSADPAEVLFRHFELPVGSFAEAKIEFDATSIAGISFVFDRSEKGAIIIDDISIENAN